MMNSGRPHVAALARDLAWLVGSAEQAGVNVPPRVNENLQAAFDFLATRDPADVFVVTLDGIDVLGIATDEDASYKEATIDLGEPHTISLERCQRIPHPTPVAAQTPPDAPPGDEPQE